MPTVDTFVIDPVNGPLTQMVGQNFEYDLYGYLINTLSYNFDLVAEDKCVVIQIKGRLTPAEGSGITVFGFDPDGLFVTDADHYVTVEPYPGYEHDGVYDETKAMVDSAGISPPIYVSAPYTRINGITVNAVSVAAGGLNANGGFENGIVLAVGGVDVPVYCDSLLIKVTPSTTTPVKVFQLVNGAGSVITNCAAYVGATVNNNTIFVAAPVYSPVDEVGLVEVYNCTFVNLSTSPNANSKFLFADGVDATFFGRIVSQNNYFGTPAGSNIEVYVTASTGEIVKGTKDITYNTEAATVAFRSIVPSTSVFENVTFATMDLHMADGSVLIGNGASVGVTTDFEGDIRTSNDIGADTIPATFNEGGGGAVAVSGVLDTV